MCVVCLACSFWLAASCWAICSSSSFSCFCTLGHAKCQHVGIASEVLLPCYSNASPKHHLTRVSSHVTKFDQNCPMLCRFQRFEGSPTAIQIAVQKMLWGTRGVPVQPRWLLVCACHIWQTKQGLQLLHQFDMSCSISKVICDHAWLTHKPNSKSKHIVCCQRQASPRGGRSMRNICHKCQSHLKRRQASASNKLNGHQQSCCKQLRHASCISHLPTTPVFLGASNSTPKAFRNSEVLLGGSANTKCISTNWPDVLVRGDGIHALQLRLVLALLSRS